MKNFDIDSSDNISISTKESENLDSSDRIERNKRTNDLYFKKCNINWNDFQGSIKENSHYAATIYWFIKYSYRVTTIRKRIIVDLNCKCEMNKKGSWVNKELISDELLEHEKGHFLIGQWCCGMFKKKVDLYNFSIDNYKEQILEIFNETLEEFIHLEKLYDLETDHMKNKKAQKIWVSKINTGIRSLCRYIF